MTIIIYPTDTVYGIGCPIDDEDAIKKVFDIKKRSLLLPLSVAFHDIEQLSEYAIIDEKQSEFIRENWNKETTFIVRKNDKIPSVVTAGSDKVGARIPDHPEVRNLIEEFGPIITTSANISGEKAPASFEELNIDIIKKADLLVKGKCKFGKPSIIWDLTKEPYEVVRN
jgi:L-threonylcarbamoyladenylate synthase